MLLTEGTNEQAMPVDTDSASRAPTASRPHVSVPAVAQKPKLTATAPARFAHVEIPAPARSTTHARARIAALTESIKPPPEKSGNDLGLAKAPTTPVRASRLPKNVHYNHTPDLSRAGSPEVPRVQFNDRGDFDPGEFRRTVDERDIHSIFDDDNAESIVVETEMANEKDLRESAELESLREEDTELIDAAGRIDSAQTQRTIEEHEAFLLEEAQKLVAPLTLSPEQHDIHGLVWSFNPEQYRELRRQFRRIWEEIVESGETFRALIKRASKIAATKDLFNQCSAFDEAAAIREYLYVCDHFYISKSTPPGSTIQEKVARMELKVAGRFYMKECWDAVMKSKPQPAVPAILRDGSGYDPCPQGHDEFREKYKALMEEAVEQQRERQGTDKPGDDQNLPYIELDEVLDDGQSDNDEDDEKEGEGEASAATGGRIPKADLAELMDFRNKIVALAKASGRNPNEYLARVGGHDFAAPRGVTHYNAWKSHWASNNRKKSGGEYWMMFYLNFTNTSSC